MICFPNGKINLGLQILSKRPDDYHNIETLLYPVPIRDALEFLPSGSFHLTVTGLSTVGQKKDNLITKAWELLHQKFKLSPLRVHLHKAIPVGAGLGGGSSDAAFFIQSVSEYFKLGIDEDNLNKLAGRLGSDCPFFIKNEPAFASGKGEVLHQANVDLREKYLIVLKPDIYVSTQKAYQLVQAGKQNITLQEIISEPIEQWKKLLINDFEEPLIKVYPAIGELKKSLYKNGAIYASMTGSGSAVYGIFDSKPILKNIKSNTYLWIGKL